MKHEHVRPTLISNLPFFNLVCASMYTISFVSLLPLKPYEPDLLILWPAAGRSLCGPHYYSRCHYHGCKQTFETRIRFHISETTEVYKRTWAPSRPILQTTLAEANGNTVFMALSVHGKALRAIVLSAASRSRTQ